MPRQFYKSFARAWFRGGMGTAQIQSARFYQGTATNNGAVTEAELSFTQFPEVGSVTTYDSTSFRGVFDNTEIYYKLAELTKVR